MPSFLDRMKSGAEKAAFEAERLVRVNQAKSVLRGLQRDLEAQVANMGQQALELHDTGRLTQPELLAVCASIEELRGKIQAQEAEVERIQQERPPSETGSEEAQQPPAAAPAERTCPNCHSPLAADVRFCQECGTRVADA